MSTLFILQEKTCVEMNIFVVHLCHYNTPALHCEKQLVAAEERLLANLSTLLAEEPTSSVSVSLYKIEIIHLFLSHSNNCTYLNNIL